MSRDTGDPGDAACYRRAARASVTVLATLTLALGVLFLGLAAAALFDL
jgi:hypothetical protein